MTQLSQGRRRGAVFSVRVSDEERATLDELQASDEGPRALGPWLVWRAIGSARPGRKAPKTPQKRGIVVPARVRGPVEDRIILDLWCERHRSRRPRRCPRSGPGIRRPHTASTKIRSRRIVPPSRASERVWGILCAPPCTEFSMARNGHPDRPRDFVEGMAAVNACMRIVLQCRPQWWALENPTGHLAKFIGRPRDTFEPCDFGDPWTKRTSLWGDFAIPARGPFVEPEGSAMRRTGSGARAVTPPGFARAFFEANP